MSTTHKPAPSTLALRAARTGLLQVIEMAEANTAGRAYGCTTTYFVNAAQIAALRTRIAQAAAAALTIVEDAL